MIKNAYVVDSENLSWWNDTKQDALNLIKQCKSEGQVDIRFTHSKIYINDNDKDDFKILEDIEVFIE